MRALIQRVQQGAVSTGEYRQAIGPGLVVLLGVAKGDTPEDAAYLAKKTAHLRIFADQQGKLNVSLLDIGGEALIISQFTLYADCRKGNRPGFDQAADPVLAEQLYQQYLRLVAAYGVPVKTGVFQTDMLVNIANDGPVTILLESR